MADAGRRIGCHSSNLLSLDILLLRRTCASMLRCYHDMEYYLNYWSRVKTHLKHQPTPGRNTLPLAGLQHAADAMAEAVAVRKYDIQTKYALLLSLHRPSTSSSTCYKSANWISRQRTDEIISSQVGDTHYPDISYRFETGYPFRT